MPPHRQPPQKLTAVDVICQFNKLKPSKFQGEANLLKYEEWIRRLENLFEIMDCPDQYKVSLAT